MPKVHFGKRGGQYYMKYGKKVYIKNKFGVEPTKYESDFGTVNNLIGYDEKDKKRWVEEELYLNSNWERGTPYHQHSGNPKWYPALVIAYDNTLNNIRNKIEQMGGLTGFRFPMVPELRGTPKWWREKQNNMKEVKEKQWPRAWLWRPIHNPIFDQTGPTPLNNQ